MIIFGSGDNEDYNSSGIGSSGNDEYNMVMMI